MEVLHPGIQSTLQDTGRTGYRSYGVGTSGAMDQFAHRVANLLVANEADAATIEVPGRTFCIRVDETVVMAATGPVRVLLAGRQVPAWRTLLVRSGQQLEIFPAGSGMYAYLSVAGGWAATEWLGSGATHLIAGQGGFNGSALQKGDRLSLAEEGAELLKRFKASLSARDSYYDSWGFSRSLFPDYSVDTVRILRGGEWDLWPVSSLDLFQQTDFRISSGMDRMGYRLTGPVLERRLPGSEMFSVAVTPGTLQVTPDGSTYLLMADAQTTGGYPRIGTVIAADLPVCAQLEVNKTVRFRVVSWQESVEAWIRMENSLELLQKKLRTKFSGY